MNSESEEILKLMEKHAAILQCGIECSNGWLTILDQLFSTMRTHAKYAKLENFKIVQVKEKFGTLRVYTDGADQYINGAITLAEHMSEVTCECCGQNGTIRNNRWIRTLCDRCDTGK